MIEVFLSSSNEIFRLHPKLAQELYNLLKSDLPSPRHSDPLTSLDIDLKALIVVLALKVSKLEEELSKLKSG